MNSFVSKTRARCIFIITIVSWPFVTSLFLNIDYSYGLVTDFLYMNFEPIRTHSNLFSQKRPNPGSSTEKFRFEPIRIQVHQPNLNYKLTQTLENSELRTQNLIWVWPNTNSNVENIDANLVCRKISTQFLV